MRTEQGMYTDQVQKTVCETVANIFDTINFMSDCYQPMKMRLDAAFQGENAWKHVDCF